MKILYILKQHSFEQPTMLAQMIGITAPVFTMGKTYSKKKAEAWKKKSGLNFYEIV